MCGQPKIFSQHVFFKKIVKISVFLFTGFNINDKRKITFLVYYAFSLNERGKNVTQTVRCVCTVYRECTVNN